MAGQAKLPAGWTDSWESRERLLRNLAKRGATGVDLDYVDPNAGYPLAILTANSKTDRPMPVRLNLASDFKAMHSERLMATALKKGLPIVEIDAGNRVAHSAQVPALDLQVRDRVARALKVAVTEVELRCTFALDAGTGRMRLDKVNISRIPLPIAADRRINMLKDLTKSVLPSATPGWSVRDDGITGISLKWGPAPKLPKLVDLAAIMPARYSPDDWAFLPIGFDAQGEIDGFDLKAGPHALIAGPTGSGKTVGLLAAVSGALARGHDLVVIDPTKAGLDFMSLRPWAVLWADTLPSAQAAVEQVYAEVGRRKEVLKQYQEVSWADLDPQVRAATNIRPLTVLIDEFGSLALEETIPKSLPKDHPLVEEATEANTAKAVIKSLVGKIAREARFVGIHLEIALQRPDVSIMGSGELRLNLSSTMQLVKPGSAPSSDALKMIFPKDLVESAGEQIALLDDGKSRGLAVVAAEGGEAKGLRVAYTPMKQIPALLEQIGVPKAVPWTPKAPTGSGDTSQVAPQNQPGQGAIPKQPTFNWKR